MLVILSGLFLRQKFSWFDILAIGISFAGVLVISLMGKSSFSPDTSSLLGIILASGSSIIWASYWIINVRDKREELEKIFLNFVFGGLFISIWIIAGNNLPDLNIGWIPAFYIGITEMAIAFVFWLTAMRFSENNSRIGNLVFISPFLALVFIHLILKEDIFWTTFVGLLLIVSGILLQQTFLKREKRKEEQ